MSTTLSSAWPEPGRPYPCISLSLTTLGSVNVLANNVAPPSKTGGLFQLECPPQGLPSSISLRVSQALQAEGEFGSKLVLMVEFLSR